MMQGGEGGRRWMKIDFMVEQFINRMMSDGQWRWENGIRMDKKITFPPIQSASPWMDLVPIRDDEKKLN